MNARDLAERYPLLYHMAWKGSWPGIADHGLLSTESLLNLFEITDSRRAELLTMKRPHSVTISHPQHGLAVIRDQKPLIDSKLRGSLTGEISLSEWYRLLNNRVFFWLTEERLLTLMGAEAYRDEAHDVLFVRTADLLADHGRRIQLTAMNTGATTPMAFPRGRETFKTIRDYPYEDRCSRRLEPIVELTVLGGVPNIVECVERVERWSKCRRSKVLHRRSKG